MRRRTRLGTRRGAGGRGIRLRVILRFEGAESRRSYDVTKVYDSGYNMNYRVKNGLAEGKQLGYYNDGKELESTAMFVRGKKRG